MSAYRIELRGCDASTRFVMELTATEIALLECVATLSKQASDFSCEPTMTVTPVADDQEEEF